MLDLDWIVVELKTWFFMCSIFYLSVCQTEQLCKFSRAFDFLFLRDGIFAKNVKAIFLERVNNLWAWTSCKLRLIHSSKQWISISLESVLSTHRSSTESTCSEPRLTWEHVSTKLSIRGNSSELSICIECSIWLCSWHASAELASCSELL